MRALLDWLLGAPPKDGRDERDHPIDRGVDAAATMVRDAATTGLGMMRMKADGTLERIPTKAFTAADQPCPVCDAAPYLACSRSDCGSATKKAKVHLDLEKNKRRRDEAYERYVARDTGLDSATPADPLVDILRIALGQQIGVLITGDGRSDKLGVGMSTLDLTALAAAVRGAAIAKGIRITTVEQDRKRA